MSIEIEYGFALLIHTAMPYKGKEIDCNQINFRLLFYLLNFRLELLVQIINPCFRVYDFDNIFVPAETFIIFEKLLDFVSIFMALVKIR